MSLEQYKNLSFSEIHNLFLKECNKQNADIELIKQLLTDKSLTHIVCPDYDNNKAMVYACINDNVELVKLLISKEINYHNYIKLTDKYQTMYSGLAVDIGVLCVQNNANKILKYFIDSFYEFKENYVPKVSDEKIISSLKEVNRKFKLSEIPNKNVPVEEYNIYNWPNNSFNIIKKTRNYNRKSMLLWLLDYDISEKILDTVFLNYIDSNEYNIYEKLIIDKNIQKTQTVMECLTLLNNTEEPNLKLLEKITDLFTQRELNHKLEDIVPLKINEIKKTKL